MLLACAPLRRGLIAKVTGQLTGVAQALYHRVHEAGVAYVPQTAET